MSLLPPQHFGEVGLEGAVLINGQSFYLWLLLVDGNAIGFFPH